MTDKWYAEMEKQLPACPACKGDLDYGFLVSKAPIQWAAGIEENRFSGVEEPMTGLFKKPLGIPMTRCRRCGLIMSIIQPR